MKYSKRKKIRKERNTHPNDAVFEDSVGVIPMILSLDKNGIPMGWINYERAAFYYSKNKVVWALGAQDVVLRGGINAKSGLQSTLKIDTIIAVDSGHSKINTTPYLSNRTLFARDENICAYCGGLFNKHHLTRDHVVPRGQGGKDIWNNVVTACVDCNNWKGCRTPEQADMELRYLPYTPNFYEHLILQNRKILDDQMKYLIAGVPKNSRLLNRYQLHA